MMLGRRIIMDDPARAALQAVLLAKARVRGGANLLMMMTYE